MAALPDLPRPLGLAVSGGPDSLALLLLAHRQNAAGLRAATVDHGLRPEARAEADAVAAVCARLGVPHDILTVRVEGSLQAAARAARYEALAAWAKAHGLADIATAHHRDDQAETLLMRLARGSGLTGLAAVRAVRPLADGITLHRPLLGVGKAELVALCAAAGLAPAADPSNEDPRFDRTAARALLAATPWLDPARLARSAGALAEAEDALAWATDRLAAERLDADSLDPAGLPPELVRRLLLRLLASHGVAPRGPELARAIDALRGGRPATLGTVRLAPGPRWRIAPAPPRRGRPKA